MKTKLIKHMAEVKVLIKGYTNVIQPAPEKEKSCSTVTLVRDGDVVMVVDPGTLKSRQILIDELKKEGVTVDDVNVVCITHSHMDHYKNIGMFPNAKSLDYWGIWDSDDVIDWKEQFSDNIKIIKTPGHNYDGITLLVKTDKGVIAVCGDVFWDENFPEDDPYASDKGVLVESRKKVIEMADWIVPGHADMYKVNK